MDSRQYSSNYARLFLSPEGLPSIAHYSSGTHDIYYSWWTGDAWARETVSTAGSLFRAAAAPDGTPHLARRRFNGPVEHLARTAGWVTTIVDPGVANSGTTAIAVDADARAHIVYSDGSNTVLRYVRPIGATTRSIEDVATGASLLRPVLILDSNSNPHVTFFDRDTWELFYAWHDGFDWSVELVTKSSEETAGSSAFAVDSTGLTHMVIGRLDENNNASYHYGTARFE